MVAAEEPDPPVAPKKVFVPKFDLPEVKDYRGQALEGFWDKFPVNKQMEGKSWVDPVKLESLAAAVGYPDKEGLEVVCKDLR